MVCVFTIYVARDAPRVLREKRMNENARGNGKNKARGFLQPSCRRSETYYLPFPPEADRIFRAGLGHLVGRLNIGRERWPSQGNGLV